MSWIYSLTVYIDAAEDKALRHTLCVYTYIYCLYINTYLSKRPNSECITVCSKLNILVSLRHSRLVQKPPVCHNTEFLWRAALRVRVSLSDLSRCHVRPARWRRNILFTHSAETSSSASGRNEAEHWFLPIFPLMYFSQLMSHDSWPVCWYDFFVGGGFTKTKLNIDDVCAEPR